MIEHAPLDMRKLLVQLQTDKDQVIKEMGTHNSWGDNTKQILQIIIIFLLLLSWDDTSVGIWYCVETEYSLLISRNTLTLCTMRRRGVRFTKKDKNKTRRPGWHQQWNRLRRYCRLALVAVNRMMDLLKSNIVYWGSIFIDLVATLQWKYQVNNIDINRTVKGTKGLPLQYFYSPLVIKCEFLKKKSTTPNEYPICDKNAAIDGLTFRLAAKFQKSLI